MWSVTWLLSVGLFPLTLSAQSCSICALVCSCGCGGWTGLWWLDWTVLAGDCCAGFMSTEQRATGFALLHWEWTPCATQ